MPLGFGRAKSEDVVALIAAKKYNQAIEILRVQLKKRGASTTVRKQLADVLVLSGKTVEAVSLLLPLADKFAREGFAAKAVSVLKKIQKIDPGRRDVEERLARLIEEKQRQAAVSLPVTRPQPEIGMEEIGIEAPASGSIVIPAAPPPSPEAAPEPPGAGTEAPARDSEIGFAAASAISTPADPPPAAAPAEPSPPEPTPPPDEAGEAPAPRDDGPDATLPLPAAASTGGAEWLDVGTPENRSDTDTIEDYDLLYVPDGGEDDEVAEDAEEEVAPAGDAPDEIMSEDGFADELMSLVDSAFQEPPGGAPALEPAPASDPEPQKGGEQIVVSPLFQDFSVDEMVAVIQGLKLLTFERGDVILREGEPGASLYTLTAGRVRAFRKDAQSGKQARIGDLDEGAFFGEMSILTGQPRMASIVALNSCELLELDRPTLDGITKAHPHVWDVLREFAEERSRARG